MGSENDLAAQVRRIRYFEGIFRELERLLKQGTPLAEVPGAENRLRQLADYYESEDWKRDFEADEAGLLPAELKRGVLSEDGVYDLLEEYH